MTNTTIHGEMFFYPSVRLLTLPFFQPRRPRTPYLECWWGQNQCPYPLNLFFSGSAKYIKVFFCSPLKGFRAQSDFVSRSDRFHR